MRRLIALLGLIVALGRPALAPPALAQDHVSFGIDWVAEAEYGGYYQALATGLYARHGLTVTIRQGGPQVNQMQLMMAGRLDFNLGGGRAIEFAQQNLPFVAVAAIFQKDPSVLIAHPGTGDDSFAALKGKPIMIGADTRAGWWRFLAAKFGYSDSQIRTYTFNLAPFLASKDAIQQGYLGSEPFLIEQKAGFKPVVLLLADAGYPGYANIVTTSTKLIAEKPDVVQRFIDASIEGWYSYLDGDPTPANQADQGGQPGDDRRAAGVWARGDEDARHRRVGRRAQAGDRRDDRRALGGILPGYVHARNVSERDRLHARLHAALRRSRRRPAQVALRCPRPGAPTESTAYRGCRPAFHGRGGGAARRVAGA